MWVIPSQTKIFAPVEMGEKGAALGFNKAPFQG